MRLSDTKNTFDRYIYLAVLVGGLILLLSELSKFTDKIEGNEIYDGTKITAAAFWLGVIAVVNQTTAFFRNVRNADEVSEGRGLLKQHFFDVQQSNENATQPSQKSALGRLSQELSSRGAVGAYIGAKLATLGVLGTMLGSVFAFGGIEQTIGAIDAGGKLDMGGMTQTFSGLRGAMTSSIVALSMGTWASALARFNKSFAKHLYLTIEQITERDLLPTLEVQMSQEGQLLGAVIQKLNTLVVGQNESNVKMGEKQSHVLNLREGVEAKMGRMADNAAVQAEGITLLVPMVQELVNASKAQRDVLDSSADQQNGRAQEYAH